MKGWIWLLSEHGATKAQVNIGVLTRREENVKQAYPLSLNSEVALTRQFQNNP